MPRSRRGLGGSIWGLTCVVAVIVFGHEVSAQTFDCPPNEWLEFGTSCYRFVKQPLKTYLEAVLFCQQSYATLVAVNTAAEHRFIQQFLEQHDRSNDDIDSQEWLTSGYRQGDGQLIWESDQSPITQNFFDNSTFPNTDVTDNNLHMRLDHIVYKLHVGADQQVQFDWAWQRIMLARPFICELPKKDTWKYYQAQRDFSYGTGILDPNLWEIGPKFVFQSKNVLFVDVSDTITPPVVLECQASGNPSPSYNWYRRDSATGQTVELTSTDDRRFTITNGRLQINNPDSKTDATTYHCTAENRFGKILGNPILVSYGYTEGFSNIRPSPVEALMYQGQPITCNDIKTEPDAGYYWFRGNPQRAVRPSLNPHFFISQNGNLYITEVQEADADEYRCSVYIKPRIGEEMTTFQVGTQLSMPIVLTVKGQSPTMYGPDIQSQFPQVFPAKPQINQTASMECLAYGRSPLTYSWTRDDAPLNPEAIFSDFNRLLTIEHPRLEDTGTYTCHVKGKAGTSQKSIHVKFQAYPYFPYPLQDQHADSGSELVWICNAIAVPKATYQWYINGELIDAAMAGKLGMTVKANILTIHSVDPELHNNMYQCEAQNSFGLARTSAQLRALSFQPTFDFSPVETTKQASVGGNITIRCLPHASPRATITWLKNGVEVGEVLPTGSLHLSYLSVQDSGVYTCRASNDLGTAENSCMLTVVENAVFELMPADQDVIQNGTTELPCKASFDISQGEVIYQWKFNDHVLDFSVQSRDSYAYRMPYNLGQSDAGTLYIINAQFEHEGQYTCIVRTVSGKVESGGYIRVLGPPGEPSGVHAYNTTREFKGRVEVWWLPGIYRGFQITKYAIQARSLFDPPDAWQWIARDIEAALAVQENRPAWRTYRVEEGILSPGTSYVFRVYAGCAELGYGPPSAQSKSVRMYDEAPIFAPENLGGGGGSVGLLHVDWNPLPRSLWGAAFVRYRLYYRRYDERSIDIGIWEVADNLVETRFDTVIARELFYTPYEVKVQAFNNFGYGPNTSVRIVYSAEDMPAIQPTSISAEAINSTAGYVYWELQPRTRNGIRGSIFAFQVNYWDEGDTRCLGVNEENALFVRFYGDVEEGLLVGMEPGGDYCVNLQFMNRAGLGSKTDNYYLGMNDAAPSNYPEYVTVMSHGGDSVRVLWRGISTIFGEDPLRGYKAWYWDIQEDIRVAKVADFGRTMTGVIHGIEKNTIYKLRVLGYSSGGDGHKSMDVYFTLGGEIVFDPTTTIIQNTGSRPNSSQLIMALICSVLSVLSYVHRRFDALV